MKVVHITTEYPPMVNGGLANCVQGLVNSSLRQGIEVQVMFIGDAHLKINQDQRFLDSGTKRIGQDMKSTKAIPLQFTWSQSIESCFSLVDIVKPDIIHIHNFQLLQIVQALKKRVDTPIVYTVHTIEREEHYDKSSRQLQIQATAQEKLIDLADYVIVLSQLEGELLKHYCPNISQKLRIVGKGIDPAEFSNAVLKCKSSNNHYNSSHQSSNKVLYVGRIEERKGLRDLFAVIPIILSKVPATEFTFVGSHNHHLDMKEAKQRLLPIELSHFHDRIKFAPWTDRRALSNWYYSSDVLVVPSWYEPFGMVILEGMLHGLPVIASDVGGPRDILVHGRTGILYPTKNVVALAYYILLLLNNNDLRKQIRTAAMHEVNEKWSWSSIVKKIKSIYEDALDINQK